VLVSGCEAGSCHFLEGNLRARERVEYAKQLLEEIGLGGRLEMFEVAASDAPKWVETVKEMTQRAMELGPAPLRRGKAFHPDTLAQLENAG
jgi:coenzyme F420-reducing hydrogenase delta subunit